MNDRDCENCKHHTEKGCDSWDCNFEQGMTREEAIKQLKTDGCYECAYGCENVVDCTAKGCKYKEAFLMAINSLEIDERYELEYEQVEPCEDAISRQAVLDIISFEDKWLFDAKGHNADTKIAFSGIKSSVLALPSVNPQEPKTGHWVRDTITDLYHCSKCRSICHQDPKSKDDYCRYCGAKMEESEASE